MMSGAQPLLSTFPGAPAIWLMSVLFLTSVLCITVRAPSLYAFRLALSTVELTEAHRALPPKYHEQSPTANDTIIMYLHFHKAGGTSVAKAAEKRHKLYPLSSNGIPKIVIKKTQRPKTIPFWLYSEEELTDFLQGLHADHVTFIAMENHWFRNASMVDELFKRKNSLELATQLRNPFSRFLSNYLFAVQFHEIEQSEAMANLTLVARLRAYHLCVDVGGMESDSLELCSAGKRARYNGTNEWNMFVRVLSNNFDREHEVTENDLETAKSELDKFDLVTVLEMPDNAALWSAKYGIDVGHINRQRAYSETFDAERARDPAFDKKLMDFEQEFIRLNHFDYALYEYAEKLHRAFGVQLDVAAPE